MFQNWCGCFPNRFKSDLPNWSPTSVLVINQETTDIKDSVLFETLFRIESRAEHKKTVKWEPPVGQGFLECRDKYLVYTEGSCGQNAKNVDCKNFLYIEYLVRRGRKQLDQLKSPDTVGLSALNVSRFPQTKHPTY